MHWAQTKNVFATLPPSQANGKPMSHSSLPVYGAPGWSGCEKMGCASITASMIREWGRSFNRCSVRVVDIVSCGVVTVPSVRTRRLKCCTLKFWVPVAPTV